jgi:arylsulfatase
MPRETGTYAGSPSFSPPIESLPARLQKKGYTTRLYTSNMQLIQWDGWDTAFDEVVETETSLFNWSSAVEKSYFPKPLMYLESIFRCFRSEAETASSLRDGWRRFATHGEDYATEYLHRKFSKRQKSEGPEFAVFNIMDVHSTIGVSTGEAISQGISDQENLQDNYENAVERLSINYEKLFNTLLAEFDWVITLSDHGELLGEHGLAGHGYGIYPDLVQIPLVISGKTNDLKYPRDALVSLIDIPATISDMADISTQGNGKSLFDRELREKALVERIGQPHLHEEMFRRHGILDSFNEYDTPLRGVALEDDRYVYETKTGVETVGHVNYPKEVIEKSFQNTDIVGSSQNDLIVSNRVKRRLKELGYA